MPNRYVIATSVLAAVIVAGVWLMRKPAAASAPGTADATSTVPRTPWGAPDLSGIWNGKSSTPLERPAKFADREFLTDEDIAALDRERGSERGRDVRAKKGTEADVEGAYNNIFSTALDAKYVRTKRSSLIVDPPDGKIPARTPEGQKRRDLLRRRAGRSPEAAEEALTAFGEGVTKLPYNVDVICSSINTQKGAESCRPVDNPEDLPGIERCMGVTVPCINGNCSMNRIVQGPDSVMIYYEQGHGGGAYRVIPLNGQPHPPSHLREWMGHSTGHWEGDTLVVETTNFTARTGFQGASENLRLTERFTRASADMILYRITLDDPASFARPWTIEVPLTLEDNKKNLIFESACYEGNYSLTSMLAGARKLEREQAATRK